MRAASALRTVPSVAKSSSFPFAHSPSPNRPTSLPFSPLSHSTAPPPPSPGPGTPGNRRASTRPPQTPRTRPPCTARSSRAQARHPGPHTTGSASAGRGSCPRRHALHTRHTCPCTCAARRRCGRAGTTCTSAGGQCRDGRTAAGHGRTTRTATGWVRPAGGWKKRRMSTTDGVWP